LPLETTVTATRIRKPRIVKPVVCCCEAQGRLIYPCEMIPAGVPVRVMINGTPYLLSAHGNQPEAGYRLVKQGGDGAVYDLDSSEGYPICDCPDCEINQRACKHCLAIAQFSQQGII
jgi:hypothetical protein